MTFYPNFSNRGQQTAKITESITSNEKFKTSKRACFCLEKKQKNCLIPGMNVKYVKIASREKHPQTDVKDRNIKPDNLCTSLTLDFPFTSYFCFVYVTSETSSLNIIPMIDKTLLDIKFQVNLSYIV